MLKIFLTGDNHIGLKYASHSEAATICAGRIAAFASMVDAANAEGCELFVVAGDLFENTGSIAKKDVKAVLELLSRFDGIVAILPGNHDYYDPNAKLWQYFRELMQPYDNIMLLCEPKPYAVSLGDNDAVLYPAPCRALHSAPGENALGWIKAADIPRDGVCRIGIAHGAVEGETIDSEGAYYLMRRDELESIPVDLWLLGHTHVPFPRGLSEKETVTDERIFNAGTHVQTDVACRSDGECFILSIDGDRTVRAKKLVSGGLRFFRRTVTVYPGELSSRLEEALRDMEDGSVVDVLLRGTVSAEEYESRHALAEEALSRFLEGTYDDAGLSRQITQELIEAEFPETSLSARLLSALSEEPKELQLAYELLTSLRGDK